MNWIANLNESVLPIVISIVGIIATGITVIVSVRKFINENHNSKKSKLKDIKNIKNRHEEIKKSNRFLHELEIQTIPFLKGFDWLEVEAIFKRNIGVATIKNLQILSKKQFLALDGSKIYIPKRSYIFFKHFKNPKSIILLMTFIASLFWLCFILFDFHSNDFLYLKVLFIALLLEGWVILNFEDLIIVNTMKNKGYMEKNDIYISEDFKLTLEEYKTFKTNYYSIDKLKELNTSSNN